MKRSSTWDNALAHFQPFIKAQGEVGYAYNLLQESFFNIFNLVMALERPERPVTFYHYALAIWHVSQNDRQQRQLAITALANLPTSLDIKAGIMRLEWAKEKADKLADYRNLIVHTPMKFWYRPKDGGSFAQIPSMGGFSTKPINIRRLGAIKSLRFWTALRNDLLNLNDYVDFVTRRIAWCDYEKKHGGPIPGALRTWPYKPRLPCIHRIKALEAIAAHPPSDHQAGPKRRRPSGGQRRG